MKCANERIKSDNVKKTWKEKRKDTPHVTGKEKLNVLNLQKLVEEWKFF